MTVRKLHGKDYYTDFRIGGKRIRRRIPGITDKREALIVEKNRKREMLGLIPDGERNFSELVKEYLNYCKTNKAPATYIREERSLRTFQALTGIKKLSEVTPIAIESYKAARQKMPGQKGGLISNRTINIDIKSLKTMFNQLIELGFLSVNPIARVKTLRGSKRTDPVEYLDESEVEALLNASSPTYRPIFYTFIKTGLRWKELVNLEWSDIDFKDRKIRVACKRKYTTKTYNDRYIPFGAKMLVLLNTLPRISSYVFATRDGKPRHNNILRELKRSARRAKISKNVYIHMLRHTFASLHIRHGTPLPVVAKLLGHTATQVTELYVHVLPNHLAETAETLPF